MGWRVSSYCASSKICFHENYTWDSSLQKIKKSLILSLRWFFFGNATFLFRHVSSSSCTVDEKSLSRTPRNDIDNREFDAVKLLNLTAWFLYLDFKTLLSSMSNIFLSLWNLLFSFQFFNWKTIHFFKKRKKNNKPTWKLKNEQKI